MVELAEEHGLAPALWLVCRDRQLAPPAVLGERLRSHHRSNVGRMIVLRQQVADVVGLMDEAGVDAVLLKGAAHLAEGIFDDIGQRVMSDIDVLVPPGDMERAGAALAAAGYDRAPQPFGLEQHDVEYESGAAKAVVELHRSIGTPPLTAVLPVEQLRARARRVAAGAVEARVLCSRDALAHHVLHAQVQDREYAYLGLPLRQLHTFHVLRRAWGDDAVTRTIAELEAAGFGPHARFHVDTAACLFDPEHDAAARPGLLPRRWATLASFALGWPTDAARNVRWALEDRYLDARYGPAATRAQRALRLGRHLWSLTGDGDTLNRIVSPRR